MKNFVNIINTIYSNMLCEWYELDKKENKSDDEIKREYELSDEIVKYKTCIPTWFKKYIKFDGHGLFEPIIQTPNISLSIIDTFSNSISFRLHFNYKGENYTVQAQHTRNTLYEMQEHTSSRYILNYLIQNIFNKLIEYIKDKTGDNVSYLFYDLLGNSEPYLLDIPKNDFWFDETGNPLFRNGVHEFNLRLNKYINEHYICEIPR